MGLGRLAMWIAGILIVIGVVLVVLIKKFPSEGLQGDSFSILWAALIIVVLLFGVIVISLFVNRVRGRVNEKKEKVVAKGNSEGL